jgi:hypothetical protein
MNKMLFFSEYSRLISKNGLKWLKHKLVSKFLALPFPGKLAAPCWKQF